jgi:hypothetical protein
MMYSLGKLLKESPNSETMEQGSLGKVMGRARQSAGRPETLSYQNDSSTDIFPARRERYDVDILLEVIERVIKFLKERKMGTKRRGKLLKSVVKVFRFSFFTSGSYT